jgi:hypothetical protein
VKILLLILSLGTALAQYPDLSGYSWVQQEGSTLTQVSGKPPVLAFTNTGNKHEKMLVATLPAAPYTVTLGVSLNQTDYTKQVSASIMLRDSAADKASIYITENEMSVTGFNSSCCTITVQGNLSQTIGVDADSKFSTNAVAYGRISIAQRRWIRISDDGTTRKFWYSNDDGHLWLLERQEASGTFVTPDQVGIAGYSLESAAFNYSFTVWEFSIN